MLTILAGLGSALAYASSDMLSQQVTRRTRPLTQVVAVLVVGALVVLPAALLIDGLPSGAAEWRGAGWAGLAGLAYLAAFSCLLRALSVGDLGLVSTLNALQGAWAVIAFVVLGQPLTLPLAVALLLCIVGGVLASREDRVKTTAGGAWALAAGVLFAVVMICYSYADGIPWLSQAAISRTTSLVVALPLALAMGALKLPRELYLRAAGAGLLEVVGLLLLTASLALGPLTVAGVTTTQFGTFGVLLGLLVLRERPRPHQWIGIICTLAGVTALAFLI